jgi:hypothetical protein
LASGWVFCYRVYAAKIEYRNKILKHSINDSNPRIREQVCDIVGDEEILELRELLKPLINDSVEYVAESAKYNYYEMF